MVTLVKQEAQHPFEDRSSILIDTTGAGYICKMSTDGVLLDGMLVHVVLDVPGHVTFVGNGEKIQCTAAAVWHAFAGADVSPTVMDAGQLLAENIARWMTIQQSLVLIQAFEHQAKTMVEHIQALPSSPRLPIPHLDSFTEEALARCDVHPTHAQVQALAHILSQSTETIIAWLRERGKIMLSMETAISYEHDSLKHVGDVVVKRRSSLHVAGTEETEAAHVHSLPSSSNAVKRTMFRWTPELIELLTDAFLSKLDGNVHATALAIATEHNWPVKAVEYKIYDLQLPGKKQQQALAVPVSIPCAEPVPEREEISPLPVANTSFPVQTGAFQWDMKVNGKFQRWGLDYPYGSFPAQPGTCITYRGNLYRLEQVSSAQLTVTTYQEKTNDE